MKARLNPIKRLWWWWKVRRYQLDPAKTRTFWEYLNANNLTLCTWEMVPDGDQHTHDLVELEMEQVEAVLNRYLILRRRHKDGWKTGGFPQTIMPL